MALTLSNSISGQFDPSESSGFFVYALRRDAEGMLLFSKVSAASTELGEFYRNDGTAIPEFGDGLDYGCYDVGVGKTSIIRNDIATEKKLVDDPNDKYQQIRFDGHLMSVTKRHRCLKSSRKMICSFFSIVNCDAKCKKFQNCTINFVG